jgi:hypothetical protein
VIYYIEVPSMAGLIVIIIKTNILAKVWLHCLRPFWIPTPKNVMIWLSYMMALSVPDEGYTRHVPDEGYTRHVSCVLIVYLRTSIKLRSSLS